MEIKIENKWPLWGFIVFCVMTYMHAGMKALRSRRDFAVERQLGATDAEICRKMRVGTYPAAVLAFLVVAAAAAILWTVIILESMKQLSIMKDMFPGTYTKQYCDQQRSRIFEDAAVIWQIFLASLPAQLLAALAAVLGTVLPTKRLLREPVTEGLRKDTD